MSKYINMPLWQLKEVYETLRVTSNIHNSSRKETCHDRMVMKSLGFVEKLLKDEVEQAEIYTEYQWISVKKRLPEEGFNCLVTNKSSGALCLAYYLTEFDMWLDVYTCKRIYGITHWILIPKLNKK